MDYQFSYQQNMKRSQKMERLSLTFGIIAIFGVSLVYPALLCGSLAIVFALLGRGGEMAMSPRTILGMVLGCTSLALVILLLVCTLFIIVSYYGGITHVPTDYEQIMLDLENILQNYSIFLESML